VLTRHSPARFTVVFAHAWAAAASSVECALRESFDVVLRTSEPSRILEALAGSNQAAEAVVVVEIRSPDFAGLSIVRAVKATRPDTRFVIVAAGAADDLIVEALVLDVEGLTVDTCDPTGVIDCVREVGEGRRSIDPVLARRVIKRLSSRLAAVREAMRVLTQRELEIVRLVGAGLTNKEIASRLFVTAGTVKVHLHNIFDKLQVRSRRALALHVREKGLT
jgi:DNA-binding NarL/FixJ family response regulator